MRKSERTTISLPRYLATYASGMTWREENRRRSNRELYLEMAERRSQASGVTPMERILAASRLSGRVAVMGYIASINAFFLALAIMIGSFTLMERRLIAAIRAGKLLVGHMAFKKNFQPLTRAKVRK